MSLPLPRLMSFEQLLCRLVITMPNKPILPKLLTIICIALSLTGHNSHNYIVAHMPAGTFLLRLGEPKTNYIVAHMPNGQVVQATKAL